MPAYDPQQAGPQYLDDLATAYRFSEVLFTAVELGIFDLLARGEKTLGEIAGELGCEPKAMYRFLQSLGELGLLAKTGRHYDNTGVASQFLVSGKECYQGNAILWRKNLAGSWRNLSQCLKAGGRIDFPAVAEKPEEQAQRIRHYLKAMDDVAKVKAQEILPFFQGLTLKGQLLDVGTGSGALAISFLACFPDLTAVLLDLPEVLVYTSDFVEKKSLSKRVQYVPANILAEWPVAQKAFDLVMLSNVVHAYSEEELPAILERAAACLQPEGYLLLHDFFLEHCPSKAAVFDLNMMVHTYNGKVFSKKWLQNELTKLKLFHTAMIPLQTDTAIIIASRQEEKLTALSLDKTACLTVNIQELGFRNVRAIAVNQIKTGAWTELKCRFGCERYGKPSCHPGFMPSHKAKEVLQEYTRALILEGEPPARDFQRMVLAAEKAAFQAGFYKSFAFWAGPCALCQVCPDEGVCRHPQEARPSMEGAGIDVFSTVRRAGFCIKTLVSREEFVKYYGLLLLE